MRKSSESCLGGCLHLLLHRTSCAVLLSPFFPVCAFLSSFLPEAMALRQACCSPREVSPWTEGPLFRLLRFLKRTHDANTHLALPLVFQKREAVLVSQHPRPPCWCTWSLCIQADLWHQGPVHMGGRHQGRITAPANTKASGWILVSGRQSSCLWKCADDVFS